MRDYEKKLGSNFPWGDNKEDWTPSESPPKEPD